MHYRNEYSLQEDNMMDTQDLRKALLENQQTLHTDSDSRPPPVEKTDSSGHRKSLYKSVLLSISL